MTERPDLWLLRHGETEWNRAGILQGHLDSRLTEKGRAQAARQGEILRALDPGPVPAWCSPLGRAVETAAIAVVPLSGMVRTDDRLMEIGLGSWQETDGAQLRAAEASGGLAGRIMAMDRAPDGEGLDAFRARCAAFLDELPGPAITVCHGVTARMLWSLWLGGPLDLEPHGDLQGRVVVLSGGGMRIVG